jgi:hypothetical protein
MEMSMKYKPSWIPRVAAGLLYLVLLSTWLLSGISARFYTGATGEDSSRVAVFNVTESSSMKKSFAVVMKPGDTLKDKTIEVTVTNSSETAVSYTIAFLLDGNLPITVEPTSTGLKQDEGATTWHTTAALAGSETKYSFQLKWDKDKNSYQYAEGIESVTVEITAVQED